MKENYYLKSYYNYDHACVKSLSLNLYFILELCDIRNFVNNLMKTVIGTFNSMIPQYYTNK